MATLPEKSRKPSSVDDAGSRGERMNMQFTAVFMEPTEYLESGNDVIAKFRLATGHNYSSEDTIRLYEVGWKSLNDCVARSSFVIPSGYHMGTDETITVELSNVPIDADKLYQLCYVSKSNKILGVTKPLRVTDSACADSASSKGDDDFVEVEEDGAFLIVKSRNQMLEARLSQVSFQKLQIEQQLRVVDLENRDLQVRVRELVTAKGELETRCASLSYDLNAVTEKYRAKAAANTEIQTRLNSLETDRTALQRRFEEQEAELLTIQKRLDLKNVEIETTRDQLRRSESDRTRLTEQLNTLQRDSDAVRQSFAIACSDAAKWQADYEAANMQRQTAEASVASLTLELDEKRTDLTAARGDVDRLEKTVASRDDQIVKLNIERKDLETRYEYCREQCDEMIAQLGAVQERTRLISDECRLTKEQLEVAERRVAELETSLEDTQRQLRRATDVCDATRAERDDYSRQLEDATRVRAELSVRLADTLQTKLDLELQLAEARSARDAIELALTDSDARLADRIEQYEENIRKYAEAERETFDRYTELESALAAKQNELNETDSALSALRISFDALDARLTKVSSSNEALRRELDASLRSNVDLVAQLDALRDENCEVHRTNLELLHKLRAARTHYEQMYRECKTYEKRLWKRTNKSTPSAGADNYSATELAAELNRLRAENQLLRSRLDVAELSNADDSRERVSLSTSVTAAASAKSAMPTTSEPHLRSATNSKSSANTNSHRRRLSAQLRQEALSDANTCVPKKTDSLELETSRALAPTCDRSLSSEYDDMSDLQVQFGRKEDDANDEWFDDEEHDNDVKPKSKVQEQSDGDVPDDDPELSAIQRKASDLGDSVKRSADKSESTDEDEEQPPLNLDPPLKPLPPPIEPELVRSGRPSTTLSHSFSNMSDSEPEEFLDAPQAIKSSSCGESDAETNPNGRDANESASNSETTTTASSTLEEHAHRNRNVYRGNPVNLSQETAEDSRDSRDHCENAATDNTAYSSATKSLYCELRAQLQVLDNSSATATAYCVASSEHAATGKEHSETNVPKLHRVPLNSTNPFYREMEMQTPASNMNIFTGYPYPQQSYPHGYPTVSAAASASASVSVYDEKYFRNCPICRKGFRIITSEDQAKLELHVADHLD